MADYRHVMTLLVQGHPYRQIESMAACSHRTISKARRVLDEERDMRHRMPPDRWEALVDESLRRDLISEQDVATWKAIPS